MTQQITFPRGTGMSRHIEQIIYSIRAVADDCEEEGQDDRARLLRTCAASIAQMASEATATFAQDREQASQAKGVIRRTEPNGRVTYFRGKRPAIHWTPDIREAAVFWEEAAMARAASDDFYPELRKEGHLFSVESMSSSPYGVQGHPIQEVGAQEQAARHPEENVPECALYLERLRGKAVEAADIKHAGMWRIRAAAMVVLGLLIVGAVAASWVAA